MWLTVVLHIALNKCFYPSPGYTHSKEKKTHLKLITVMIIKRVTTSYLYMGHEAWELTEWPAAAKCRCLRVSV